MKCRSRRLKNLENETEMLGCFMVKVAGRLALKNVLKINVFCLIFSTSPYTLKQDLTLPFFWTAKQYYLYYCLLLTQITTADYCIWYKDAESVWVYMRICIYIFIYSIFWYMSHFFMLGLSCFFTLFVCLMYYLFIAIK